MNLPVTQHQPLLGCSTFSAIQVEQLQMKLTTLSICFQFIILRPLFCPPALWIPTRAELSYLNDYEPDIQSYRHIFWSVATWNHWVQIELYLSPEHAQFYFTVPNSRSIRETLLPLINHIIAIARVDPDIVSVENNHQDTLQGLCGITCCISSSIGSPLTLLLFVTLNFRLVEARS